MIDIVERLAGVETEYAMRNGWGMVAANYAEAVQEIKRLRALIDADILVEREEYASEHEISIGKRL